MPFTSGRISIADRAVSSCLPPWLLTTCEDAKACGVLVCRMIGHHSIYNPALRSTVTHNAATASPPRLDGIFPTLNAWDNGGDGKDGGGEVVMMAVVMMMVVVAVVIVVMRW